MDPGVERLLRGFAPGERREGGAFGGRGDLCKVVGPQFMPEEGPIMATGDKDGRVGESVGGHAVEGEVHVCEVLGPKRDGGRGWVGGLSLWLLVVGYSEIRDFVVKDLVDDLPHVVELDAIETADHSLHVVIDLVEHGGEDHELELHVGREGAPSPLARGYNCKRKNVPLAILLNVTAGEYGLAPCVEERKVEVSGYDAGADQPVRHGGEERQSRHALDTL